MQLFKGDKIRTLDEKANKLRQTHPEAAEQIYDLQRQINEQWNQLTQKANKRKDKLLGEKNFISYADRRQSPFFGAFTVSRITNITIVCPNNVEQIDTLSAALFFRTNLKSNKIVWPPNFGVFSRDVVSAVFKD